MDTILKTTVDEDQHSKLVEKYRKAKLANENQHNERSWMVKAHENELARKDNQI